MVHYSVSDVWCQRQSRFARWFARVRYAGAQVAGRVGR